ncbi:MAG: hypothetical protein JKY50_00050 [Oleispira sp.]|nr:hypothetical protein [Oleispira sp.]
MSLNLDRRRRRGSSVVVIIPDEPVIETFALTTTDADVSSIAVAKPTGVSVGDLLIIAAGSDDSTSTNQFADDVTGWTFIGTDGTSSSDVHVGAWWRIADGTEPATTTITPTTTDTLAAYYFRISNAHGTAPITNNQVSNGSTNLTLSSGSTAVDDQLLLIVAFHDGNDGVTFNINNSFVEGDSFDDASSAGAGLSGVFASLVVPTGGTNEGITTLSGASGDGMAGIRMSIKPPTP